MRIWLAGLAGLLLLVSGAVTAKTVQNTYLRFELPDNWNCGQEGVAWVCSPSNAADSREALIVATAKVAGPEDTLESFTHFLKQPKTLITKGKSSLSQPLSLGRRSVGGSEWVEAKHLSSEVPNFNTRYLATVKNKLALLISYSADRASTAKFDSIFNNAIRTIQVDTTQPAIAKALAAPQNEYPGMIGPNGPVDSAGATVAASQTQPSDKRKQLIKLTMIAVGVFIAVMIIRKII